MKCTLRRLPEGIVATTNKGLCLHQYYYDIEKGVIGKADFPQDLFYKEYHKILASTFGVGLELNLLIDESIVSDKKLIFDFIEVGDLFDKENFYKITDNKLIIEL